jgi:hypothetical protein
MRKPMECVVPFLRKQLEAVDQLAYKGRNPRVNLLLELGKPMVVEAGERGVPNACYCNALMDVARHQEGVYIEGEVACCGIGLTHAWVEKGGKFFDVTIKPSDEYLGLRIPRDIVWKVMQGKFWKFGDGVLGCLQFYKERTRNSMIKKIREFNGVTCDGV